MYVKDSVKWNFLLCEMSNWTLFKGVEKENEEIKTHHEIINKSEGEFKMNDNKSLYEKIMRM